MAVSPVRHYPFWLVGAPMKHAKHTKVTSAAVADRQFCKAKVIASKIGTCARTIHRWSAAGHFAARKVTERVVVYDLAEVLAFVEAGKVDRTTAAGAK